MSIGTPNPKLNVDETSINGTQTKVANNGATNNGIQTANVQGSNQDVNAQQTQIGSLATINSNTSGATLSPMQTTQTQPVEPLDPTSAWQQIYNQDIANNNLAGQVDDMTTLTNATTNANNATISKPQVNVNTQQAQQNTNLGVNAVSDRFITNYEKRITDAKLNGDYQTAEAMQGLLDNYYATNGITPTTTMPNVNVGTQDIFTSEEDRINEKYDVAFKALDNAYVSMYGSMLNDVLNGVVAQVGNLINFNYDPMKDRALHIAQGYAVGKVKETMNATGMYYSTMTQSAITSAISELVPIYEKMAKEEIQTNLQALYNLGNYLMNLESQQFNMWKANVDLKLEEINQKRKDVQEAWERANMLGYIDNQASTVLGIAPGTLTYSARMAEQARQDSLNAELRGYEQDQVMARLNDTLQKERIRLEAGLQMQQIRERARLDEVKARNDYIRKKQLIKRLYTIYRRKYDGFAIKNLL